MKKLLIYFCLILSFIMLIPNTYCSISQAPSDYYKFSYSTYGLPTNDITSDAYVNNSYSDFYNQCYYTNFDVNFSSTSSSSTPTKQYFYNLQFDNYPAWADTQYFYISDTWYPFGNQYSPYIIFDFYVYKNAQDRHFLGFRCDGYTLYGFDDFKLPFNYDDFSYNSYILPFHYEPSFFYDAYWDTIDLDVTLLNMYYYLDIEWSFDFVCPSGYYYDNFFGIALKPHLYTNSSDSLLTNQIPNFIVQYISNDDLSFVYNYTNSDFFINSSNSINSFLMLLNKYNPTYDYIKSFNISTRFSNSLSYNNFGNSISFILNSSISTTDGWERRMVVSYTYNSIKYGNSSIISVGVNNYYRSGEWWDVTVHIYNLFVYLIFDAPILSDVINFISIIISFIVDTFEWFISLFSGVDNVIFISIFLGFIVLSFIFKLIL